MKLIMEVCLATRAERKKWFAIATGWIIALALMSVFVLIWGRILKNLPLFITSLIVVIGLVSVQAAFKLLDTMKWISIYQPKEVDSIILSENLMLLGSREILVSTLKNLVIESDGYTGKWAGRSPHTGDSKLTFVHEADMSEERYLITVSSLADLNKLRILSDIWRTQGISVLVMD